MKIYKYKYEGYMPLENLTNYVDKDDILFYDIETTGLSKKTNHIYLIGIGYYADDTLNIIQWFAENEQDEVNVLRAFLDYSESFNCLVNYNGKSFDIPFTIERLKKYGLFMPDFDSFDIYTLVKPLKNILSLYDITQKSVEQFLKIKREDKYNGGELINVYKKYTYGNHCGLDLLLLHNKEDVLNMHYLTKILDYNDLFDLKIYSVTYSINTYTDFDGNEKKEILMTGSHSLNSLPRGINLFKNLEYGRFFINISQSQILSIRLPIIEDTLFYYIENYKDYYYIKSENMCILKSMAGGVQKENRENAKKENCCVALSDKFIPVAFTDNLEGIKLFRPAYKSKVSYIRLEDFYTMDTENMNMIANCLYKIFLGQK